MSPRPRTIPVGERHGRLAVRVERTPGQPVIQATCDCGAEVTIRIGEWGKTKSCGCYRREVTIARSTRHGQANTPVYMAWADMVHRCSNPDHKRWPDYGGRGITVCERWRDFANFYADMGERPSGLTLDRIDNERGYEPSNCRWASRSTQSKNRRPSAYAGNKHDALTGRFLPKGEDE